ncbi:hypothetical protein GCM10029963_33270 [Micromonospora andamanensis]|uniref:hypothetical protein n=1 Tax=Micromonospora andamanensis TaxID=1287068 RepID=UPI00194F866C|nr:hypothetical protein [Micromonospora andamanensis]GIJ42018.1 hypothetical protein Vwe01_53430 [Micromonospora andamanensis]
MLTNLPIIGMTILLLHVTGQPTTLPTPADIGHRVAETRLDRAMPCARCVLRHLVMTIQSSTPDTTGVPPGHTRR